MKLEIRYDKDDDGYFWRCELLDEQAMWLGVGQSPIEAFNDYVRLVKHLDEPNKGHFDYDWCEQRGLIR